MWSNWAGDQRCEPATVERPSGVGEVAGAVERAVAARNAREVRRNSAPGTAGARGAASTPTTATLSPSMTR